jgi:hypothetical protein
MAPLDSELDRIKLRCRLKYSIRIPLLTSIHFSLHYLWGLAERFCDVQLLVKSGPSVLNYHSSWRPAASHLQQVSIPIPGWPLHSSHAFHRWHPPGEHQKLRPQRDAKRTSRTSNSIHGPLSYPPLFGFSGCGTARDSIILDR